VRIPWRRQAGRHEEEVGTLRKGLCILVAAIGLAFTLGVGPGASPAAAEDNKCIIQYLPQILNPTPINPFNPFDYVTLVAEETGAIVGFTVCATFGVLRCPIPNVFHIEEDLDYVLCAAIP
jgi:hypothetical protein